MSPVVNPNGVSTLDIVGNENAIDGVNYRVEMSKTLAQNIFIQMRTRSNKFVTGKYVENGIKAGAVVINRVKKIGGKPRTMTGGANGAGTTNNKGLLNTKPKILVGTDQYTVFLLHVYDERVTVPRVAENLLPVDLVNAEIENLAGEIQEWIDSCTIATMIAGTARHASNVVTGGGALTDVWAFLPATITTNSLHNGVKDSIKILLRGDKTQGISQYTPSGMLVTVDFGFDLLDKDNGVIVGGSNYAQELIAKGTLSPEQAYLEWGTGTMGIINGVPVIFMPDQLLDLVKEWLSTSDGTAYVNDATANGTFIDSIQAIVVDYIATVRGIADETLDVRQSSEQRTTNLLPLWQWGVESLYGSGVSLIVDNGTVNPYNATTNHMVIIGSGVGA